MFQRSIEAAPCKSTRQHSQICRPGGVWSRPRGSQLECTFFIFYFKSRGGDAWLRRFEGVQGDSVGVW